MRIRRYEHRDHDAVKTLHRLAMQDVGSFLPGPWDHDLEAIPETYLNGTGEFLVAEVGSEIVAMGALKLLDNSRREIKRLRVAPPYQRQGLGHEILSRLELCATSIGYRYLELDTLENQAGAIRFFTKYGYHQVGTRMFEGRGQLLFLKDLANETAVSVRPALTPELASPVALTPK